MKSGSLALPIALAAGVASLLTPAASAQAPASPANWATGDLLLGFNEQGVTSDYILDIGPASSYFNATSAFAVSGLGNFTSDLSSASLFGSGWASNTASTLVQWGVVGATKHTPLNGTGTFGLPNNTVFLTVLHGSTAPTPFNSTTQAGNVDTNILSVGNGVGGYLNSTATANSPVGVIQSLTTVNSWGNGSNANNGAATIGGDSQGTNNVSAFQSGYSVETPQAGVGDGPTNTLLDLYELTPGASPSSTLIGTFSLSSTALTFTPVPEPGSAALAFFGAAFFLIRRSRWTRRSYARQ